MDDIPGGLADMPRGREISPASLNYGRPVMDVPDADVLNLASDLNVLHMKAKPSSRPASGNSTARRTPKK